MCAYVRAYVSACVRACARVRACVRVRACARVCVWHVRACVRVGVRMCECMCVQLLVFFRWDKTRCMSECIENSRPRGSREPNELMMDSNMSRKMCGMVPNSYAVLAIPCCLEMVGPPVQQQHKLTGLEE